MTLETFFEKFDEFADAPGAVGKMRGLILRLAMQGQLSEQKETDIPVSQLLRQIETERKAIGIKGSEQIAIDSREVETLNDIPLRWSWVRFGGIARHNAGKTLDKGRNRGELRDYITTSNLYWGFFQLDELRQMPIQEDELDRCTAKKGDLLIVEGGEAGRAAVWPHAYDISFQNHVHRARFFGEIDPYFVQRYFEKLNATGEIERYRKGVGISNMAGKALASIPIPLPPLAEQKRIVAKVEELMALCDRLEAQQQEREERAAALARASLTRFAEAPTPANLHYLFRPSYAISPADLRKSILTLAVQGKLVPQDPNDAPVEVPTLSRLTSSKGERGAPFELPGNWKWMQLGQVSELINGDRSKNYPNKAEYVPEGVAWINTGHIERDGTLSTEWMNFITRKKFDSLRSGKVRLGDLVYCLRGATLGKTAIITQYEEGAVASSLVIIRLIPAVEPRYAYRFLTSPLGREQIFQFDNGSAQPNLSANSVKKYWVPLPPLAEQRRIVAKVDQLMALVDELETQLAASRTTAAKLLDALVAGLANSH